MSDKFKTKLQRRARRYPRIRRQGANNQDGRHHSVRLDRPSIPYSLPRQEGPEDRNLVNRASPARGGSTNLADALGLLLDGKYPFVETVVVVTDGKPDNFIAALANGKLLKDTGTEILVIGTEDADWGFLEALRSRPDLSVRTSDEGLEKATTDATKLFKP